MASTAGDTPPSSPAAPPSSFLHDDDHLLFFSYSSSPSFLDAGSGSSLFPAAATGAQETPPPPPPAPAARKPPRKRPRESRRPPTTVLSTDASNFRAMVQEFTGFPAPPMSFAPRLVGPGGALFAAAAGMPSGSSAAVAGAPFPLLLRPSPLKLAAAAPRASPPDALSLFANSGDDVDPDAGATPASSRSGAYGAGFDPMLSGGLPRDDDDGVEAAEGESPQGHGHGFLSSFLRAGNRYQ
ncbi:hypothetical protein ACP4OV_019039 [Aristida adscensionis]